MFCSRQSLRDSCPVPIIALRACACSASQLGLILRASVWGRWWRDVRPAVSQEVFRQRHHFDSVAILLLVYLAMAITREVPALMVSTSCGHRVVARRIELWVAGQRVMPSWVRTHERLRLC